VALRQIAWVEGASLHVDIDGAGVVVALECWSAATRAAIVSLIKSGTAVARDVTVAAGQTQRWSLPKNRQWTYDQLTDEAGFRAELRLA
jgi:hypothetical protein